MYHNNGYPGHLLSLIIIFFPFCFHFANASLFILIRVHAHAFIPESTRFRSVERLDRQGQHCCSNDQPKKYFYFLFYKKRKNEKNKDHPLVNPYNGFIFLFIHMLAFYFLFFT